MAPTTTWLTQKQAEEEILRRMPSGPQIDDSGVRLNAWRVPVQPGPSGLKGALETAARGQMMQAQAMAYPGEALAHGLRIADEVRQKWRALAQALGVGAQDNIIDAGRHAEWQYRTATEIDPEFAELVGWLHEILPRNTPPARRMDERNNRAAVDGARAGRKPTWDELERRPSQPSPDTTPWWWMIYNGWD